MPDATEILDALHGITSRMDDDMSEKAVYELFELNEEEREVIEKYLEVF